MNNNLRKEEYAVAANFLKTSFANDRAELAVRFPEFDVAYQTAFEAKIDEVEDLEQGVVLTEAQKSATSDLYMATKELNNELNYLGFYFKRASLDKTMISNVKKDLTKGNVEGAAQKITGIVQFITDKQAVLVPKGMAAGFPAELAQTKTLLNEKNELQNEKMDALKDLHNDNKGVYNELKDYIKTITEAGKIKYKGTVASDKYTVTKLIDRMRSSNSGGVTPPPAV